MVIMLDLPIRITGGRVFTSIKYKVRNITMHIAISSRALRQDLRISYILLGITSYAYKCMHVCYSTL